MNKCFFFLILFVFSTHLAFSQSIEQIRNSSKYIYGLGESSVYEKADKSALDDLISQISVSVESNFEYFQSDSNFVYQEYAKSVITTYSSATLSNTLRIEEKKNGVYTVVRYLSKRELNEIFNKRQESIFDYIEEGIKSENSLQLADALRNFYWAYILLNSHPYYNDIKYPIDGDTVFLKIYLPNKINKLFRGINIEISDKHYDASDKHTTYTLSLTYNGEPIQNLEYSYKNEFSWTGSINANNGTAYLDFYNDLYRDKGTIQFRIEYIFENKAFFDKEVHSVLISGIDLPYFASCEKSLKIGKTRNRKSEESEIITLNEIDKTTNSIVLNNLNHILDAIQNQKHAVDNEIFTAEGLQAYNKLIKYGNAFILTEPSELNIVKVNDEIIIRSIPMKFSFTKNESFTEDVVFVFNDEGQCIDINFSLSQVSIDDIVSKEERFATTEDKYFIIRFLENYKTAYCLKRIEYIEKVFADDALIIVGKVLKKADYIENPIQMNLNQDEIEYIKVTKVEYVSRLKRIFGKNEFVNIHFEDCVVKKAKKDINIYGIQIAQYYTSATYSDKGYLFLLLDLRDTLNPIVHVRTWQPTKNADGSIYGLEDFPFQTH
jgi:hypothetical protein